MADSIRIGKGLGGHVKVYVSKFTALLCLDAEDGQDVVELTKEDCQNLRAIAERGLKIGDLAKVVEFYEEHHNEIASEDDL